MNKITKRNDKIAFAAVGSGVDETFYRLKGFTEFSLSKNPIEYSRRYIDETIERNDVVGYAPSISYSFDKFSDDKVHLDFASIADRELVGAEAVRKIIIVDMTGESEIKSGVCRQYSVIPDREGDDNNAYTYSGTLKVNGEFTTVDVTSVDNWESCSIIE